MVCKISNELFNNFDVTLLTINNINKNFHLEANINLKSLNVKKYLTIFHLYYFLKNEYDILISNVYL